MNAQLFERWEQEEVVRRRLRAKPGAIPIDQFRTYTGLELLDAVGRGELPSTPMENLIGFLPVEWESGRIVFQGIPGPQHFNPMGTIHGGYAATLLDACVGSAVQTMLPAGICCTTVELKVNYIRAITDQIGPVRAEGKVVNLGRQIGIAEGRITDIAGKLYAMASTTCLLFSV